MPTRGKFIARMRSQLDAWSAELDKLESRTGHARAENKLGEIEHAGEQTWLDLKDEVERAWVAFKLGLDALRDFSDHS